MVQKAETVMTYENYMGRMKGLTGPEPHEWMMMACEFKHRLGRMEDTE